MPEGIKLSLKVFNALWNVGDNDVFPVFEASPIKATGFDLGISPNMEWEETLPFGPVEASIDQSGSVDNGKLVVHVTRARRKK